MAGTVKANIIQLGDSGTPSQNFVIQTNVDGSGKMSRGNAGATTQDILTWDSNGRVSYPQTVIGFGAYNSVATTLVNNVSTKVTLGAEEFDYGGYFDTVNSRFQPLVAGLYQVTGQVQINGNASAMLALIYKNGAEFKRGPQPQSAFSASVNALMYLNGTTDYIELWGYQNWGSNQSSYNNAGLTFFQAFLVAKA
jgi:hypothetical protein